MSVHGLDAPMARAVVDAPPGRLEAVRAAWRLARAAVFTMMCAAYVLVRYAAIGTRRP